MERVRVWIAEGYSQAMKTPDDTLIYVGPTRRSRSAATRPTAWAASACKFSNWACGEDHTTGKPPDPRSFCIQKTLHEIAHGAEVRTQLMFSGHNVYKFRQDPFYSNGFVPTVRQLVERIATGD